jgi:hypothetical protein
MLGNSSLLGIDKHHHSLLCRTSQHDDEDDEETDQTITESMIELAMIRVTSGKGRPEDFYSAHESLMFSNDTMELLRRNPSEPLLVVFNIGAHYHNLTLYARDVDYVKDTFQSLNRGPKSL